jgi:hypothetical protein
MTQILALPGFSIGLPLAVLFGSVLVSRTLKISTVGTILAASAPLSLPFIDLPVEKEFSQLHPEYVIGSAWAVMLAAAIGWVLIRPIISGAIASLGLVRAIYLGILAVAVVVVGVLMIDPEALTAYAPGWRGSAGLVLLCASLLSMSCALARVLRAAMLLVVWSFVSVVLASEVFLHKLPQEIVRDDLKRIQSLVPSEKLQRAIEQLDVRSSGEGLKAFVLSGSSAAGVPAIEEKALSSRIRGLFHEVGLPVSVHDASIPGASVFDISRVAREKIEPQRPDVVFIVGWESDRERGVNSLGVPGLSESEARALQTSQNQASGMAALVESARTAISSSALYRYLRSQVQGDDPDLQKPRVSPGEYREQLQQTVSSLKGAGSQVVLIAEPSVSDEDLPYREAMLEVAVNQQALFLPSDKLMTQAADPLVFSRGSLLSDRGYDLLAQRAVDHIKATEILSDGAKRHDPAGQGV